MDFGIGSGGGRGRSWNQSFTGTEGQLNTAGIISRFLAPHHKVSTSGSVAAAPDPSPQWSQPALDTGAEWMMWPLVVPARPLFSPQHLTLGTPPPRPHILLQLNLPDTQLLCTQAVARPTLLHFIVQTQAFQALFPLAAEKEV